MSFQMYLDITTGITAFGLTGCIAFICLYWWFSKGAWIDTDEGRFIMLCQATLASLFALILSSRVWVDWWQKENITLALYGIYAIEAWWPIRLLIRAAKIRRDYNEQKVLARRARENR